MISYIRAGLVLAVLSLTAWGGWTARAWLEDSRELDQAKEERDAAIARERAAEAKATAVETVRAKIAGELEKEKANIRTQTRTIIKHIPTYVDRRDCTVSPEGIKQLNNARAAG